MVLGLSHASAVAPLISGVAGWGGPREPDTAAVLVLLIVVVGLRMLLFAVIEASSFPADTRYLYAVMRLYECVVLLLIHRAVVSLTATRDAAGRFRPAGPPS